MAPFGVGAICIGIQEEEKTLSADLKQFFLMSFPECAACQSVNDLSLFFMKASRSSSYYYSHFETAGECHVACPYRTRAPRAFSPVGKVHKIPSTTVALGK